MRAQVVESACPSSAPLRQRKEEEEEGTSLTMVRLTAEERASDPMPAFESAIRTYSESARTETTASSLQLLEPHEREFFLPGMHDKGGFVLLDDIQVDIKCIYIGN